MLDVNVLHHMWHWKHNKNNDYIQITHKKNNIQLSKNLNTRRYKNTRPSQYDTLTLHWFNVRLSSAMLVQHWTNIGSVYPGCWGETLECEGKIEWNPCSVYIVTVNHSSPSSGYVATEIVIQGCWIRMIPKPYINIGFRSRLKISDFSLLSIVGDNKQQTQIGHF